jgi:hypothetical protein
MALALLQTVREPFVDGIKNMLLASLDQVSLMCTWYALPIIVQPLLFLIQESSHDQTRLAAGWCTAAGDIMQ